MIAVLSTAAARLAPLAPHAMPVLRVAGREAIKMVCINLAVRGTTDVIIGSMRKGAQPKPTTGATAAPRPTTRVRETVGVATEEVKDWTVHFTAESLRTIARALKYLGRTTFEIVKDSGPTIALFALAVGLSPYYPNAAVGCYLGAVALIGLRFARIYNSMREGVVPTTKPVSEPTDIPVSPVVVVEPELEIAGFETLDTREAKHRPFQYGVAVAHRHLVKHPERRDACETALREALAQTDLSDGVQIKVIQGFTREAMKIVNRSAQAS